MDYLVRGFGSLIRNVVHPVSRPLSPESQRLPWERGSWRNSKSTVRHSRVGPYAGFLSDPFAVDLSLYFDTKMTTCKALDDLQGLFWLTRLEVQAPRLELDDWQRMVAVQALSGAVIQMSLLAYLSLPENLLTKNFLSHISILPRLETLVVFPAPLADDLLGEGSHGFGSLRSQTKNSSCASYFTRFKTWKPSKWETWATIPLD
ncbi:hypothetical protein BJ322DRAFT_1023890 [Thelephora terrestris]|uniref:Uncharacterized protein n=1 Tax=Thelephora terrestris TaxID=56493 RepID=A0A9P6L2X9_9AGAM|nr:hypothetical protein BJ322DRAFT_1023890 [Thelephora terrestris]